MSGKLVEHEVAAVGKGWWRHLVSTHIVAVRGETFLKKGSPHTPSKDFCR